MTARANLYYPQGDLLPLAIVEALGFREAAADSAAPASPAPDSAAPEPGAADTAAAGSAAAESGAADSGATGSVAAGTGAPASAPAGSADPGSAAAGSVAADSGATGSVAAGTGAPEASAAGTPRPVVVQLGEARIELAQMSAADRVAHLEALQDYLSNRCALQDPALPAKLNETRTAVTVTIEPGLDAAGLCARFVRAVAARTGAVVLMDDGTLEDAEGRTVAYPAADEENPLEYQRVGEPPPAARVARRALVLAALAWRGQIEVARTPIGAAQVAVWKAWFEKQGLVEEMDAAEIALFASKYGTLTERQLIHCGWGVEAAAVLAWGLRLLELPPHDTKVSPGDLATAVGLFAAEPPALAAELRPRAEIAAMTARLFGIAWRLLRFTSAPSTFDFVGFSSGAWFGGFDLEGISVLEGDLAIGGAPISKAPRAAAEEATSIAVERFRAARWLDGRQAAWSEEVPATVGAGAAPVAAGATIPDAGSAASAAAPEAAAPPVASSAAPVQAAAPAPSAAGAAASEAAVEPAAPSDVPPKSE